MKFCAVFIFKFQFLLIYVKFQDSSLDLPLLLYVPIPNAERKKVKIILTLKDAKIISRSGIINIWDRIAIHSAESACGPRGK